MFELPVPPRMEYTGLRSEGTSTRQWHRRGTGFPKAAESRDSLSLTATVEGNEQPSGTKQQFTYVQSVEHFYHNKNRQGHGGCSS